MIPTGKDTPITTPTEPSEFPNGNPGSPEAQAKGCTCPVLDNNHGYGFPWGTTAKPSFWVNSDCPLHGDVHAACTGGNSGQK